MSSPTPVRSEISSKSEKLGTLATWRRLMYNFTQDTTFHGVRYITADTPYVTRRVVWILVVCSAFGFFIWFMTDRFLFLLGNPRTVDVEVIYTDQVRFPAVTICNQNLFRTSATHNLGLHDIVEDSFRLLQNGGVESDTEGFEMYRDSFLEGIGTPHAAYFDITAAVCKEVCEKLHGDSCCSVVYSRGNRGCYITPLEIKSKGVKLVDRVYTDYYRRRKCEVQTTAKCDFEELVIEDEESQEGFCGYSHDFTKPLKWKQINQNTVKKLDVDHPPFDHTNMTSDGKYILVATKFHQPNTVAHLVSPYILSEDNTCVHFYYQIRGGILNVIIREQGNVYKTIWSQKALSKKEWEKAYLKLPPGYYRIVLEAETGTGTDAHNIVNIAVDDLSIGHCEEELRCKESQSGSGYTGTLMESRSGTACEEWSSTPDYLRELLWWSRDLAIVQENIPSMGSYCRNPDNDPNGPWCYTHATTGQMEYCDIPSCDLVLGCRPVEFACGNGRCISRDLACNEVDDCGDNTDEIFTCNRTETVTCAFEDEWMCGYVQSPLSQLQWRVINWENMENVLTVDTDKGRDGDISRLLSPQHSSPVTTCLHLEYYITGQTVIDISIKDNSSGSVLEEGQRLCSLSVPDGEGYGWRSTDILLPPGMYTLAYDVLFIELDHKIYIDNITLLNENCTAFEEILPEITTMEMTTLVTTEYTGNMTDWSDMSTTDRMTTEGTTAFYDNTTTPIPWVDIHEAFEHGLCSANGTRCETCIKSFAPRKECSRTFEIVISSYEKLRIKCNPVRPRFRQHSYTVESCKNETLTVGGNAFNMRHKQCQIQKCDDLSDIDTIIHPVSREHVDGWDGYILKVGEADGISCTFVDACSCGYRYLSSNIYDVWSRQEVETIVPIINVDSNFTTNLTETRREYYMKLANLNVMKGRVPRKGEWSRLITPVQYIGMASCLRFNYYTSYIDIHILRYWGNETEEIMSLYHDGQQRVWHTATVNIPAGDYGLIFQTDYGGQWTEENAGLANINVTQGRCFQDTWGPFNCSFDEPDYCGYQDRSPGNIKWVRSKNYNEGASPGGYYMRTSGLLQGKGTAILASPMYTYENRSCVQFSNFLQGNLKEHVSTLSVATEDEIGNSQEVVWRVHSITDNQWHYGQTQIEPGTYRLVFELSGNQIRTGIDAIVVTEGDCPSYNCSQEEYECEKDFACILQSGRCDGIPNCYLGDDEIFCGEENKTMVDTGEGLEEQEKPDTTDMIDLGIKQGVDLGSSLNLTEIYMRAGHQGEDLIYGCKWEGEGCSYENFTKQVTDYGLCYTFNSEEQGDLSTAKTGSRFGLSVTMNIEQYEYMRGPQSDAGIKVFLHSKNELPEVRDLGFAIAPGVHALVAIRLNEAENLEYPIGDCGKQDLEFYTGDSYVYSKCIRECETKQIHEMCGCRDAYMPGRGRSIDDPPVCNLTMYFTCAIPAINSVNLSSSRSQCECPKPCKQTIYEPGLSQAALSVLSVDNILTENKQLLLKKYHSALESRQRVEEHIFSNDMLMITEIIKQYRNIRRFSKTYLGDVEKSSFAKIWTATGTLLRIFEGDIGDLMQDLPNHQEAYDRFYEDPIILLNMYMQELDKGLKELSQLLKFEPDQKQSKKRGNFLNTITNNLKMKTSLAHENFETFYAKLTNNASMRRTSEDDNGYIRFLPKTFAVRNQHCLPKMKELSRNLFDIETILTEADNWAAPNPRASNVKNSTKTLLQLVKGYFRESKYVSRCINEYSDSLKKTMEWVESAEKEIDDFMTQSSPFASDLFNFTIESGIIEKDERAVEKLKASYAHAKTSKVNYLGNFDPSESSSEILSRINSFVDRIQSRLTTPLRSRITKMRHELEHYYEKAFYRASNLQKYLEPGTFYYKSSTMKIWRVPSPNLENPDRYFDTAREYWKVWNRDMSIQDFAEKEALKYIKEGVEAFCDPLLKILDDFEEQLLLNRQKVTSAIEKVRDEHVKYHEMRKIDHTFILNNFMAVDVYFSQLKHQNVKQLQAYQITQFLGDVGGFMGLLLGGSILTLFELCDLIIFHLIKNLISKDPDLDTESRGDDASLRQTDEVYSNRLAPIATPDKEYWAKTKDPHLPITEGNDLLPPPPPPGFGTTFDATYA